MTEQEALKEELGRYKGLASLAESEGDEDAGDEAAAETPAAEGPTTPEGNAD